ncbi:MAG: hypothetical protein JSV42_19260 [Chloroflexota bacterium]|nr:MAG: hypothetical protein JSV42_19260 [Chloroflexota bacterium]
MTWYDKVVWCDGCGAEITWGPVLVAKRPYCCRDCSQGYPCKCGERMELDDEQRETRTPTTSTITSY